MKNLSIEDPGMPAEKSVITCKYNRAQLKRKAISNPPHPPSLPPSPLPPICVPSLMSTAEAIHLGSLVAAHGYIFPISDHVLTLKDDGTLYRFQVQKAATGESLMCVRRPLIN